MDQLEKSGHKMKMKLLQDLLKCNICLETLSNPKILQCHHFFCSTCIQSHHENSQEGNQAFCPICRRPFVLDFSGAEDLPPCHFVNELLEKFSKEPNLKTNTEIERNCQGLCLKRKSKVKATFSCPPCGIDLCEVCLEAHQFFNAHHKIVDVEDYQRPIMIQSPEMEDENLLCDQHTDHNLSELCLDCKAVLCQVCKKKHHDHNCISLEDIKSEAQMMRNMLRRIKSDLERRREDVTTFEFFLKTSETKAIKRIQSTHKEIKERIDTQKTESEEKLKLHSESLTIEIAESLTKIDTNSKSVESILELIHTLLAFGNDRCFLMYWQNIHDRYQSIDLENVELPNVESKDIIRFNPTDLEKLSIGYLTPAKPDIEWMNKDQNQDEEEREDEKEIEDYTDCMINTAHMLRGSHLYSFLPQKPLNPVNSKRHALRVLPKPPKLKTVIEQKTPVPHFHGEHNTYLSLLTEQDPELHAEMESHTYPNLPPPVPHKLKRFEDKICRTKTLKENPKFCTNLQVTGGTLLKNGNVALASYDNGEVSIFRLTGQKIVDFKIQNPWDVAARLDCIAGEVLFVSVLKSEKMSARIEKINLSGWNQITTFTKNVVSPYGIAFTINNELCVCEKKRSTLIIFGEDGGIIREITNVNFICPWYVAVKSHDELLLSDFIACCVWHLNSSGEIIEKFDKSSESDPTQFHPAKCVYSDGKIFISDQDGGKIRVLSQTGQVRTVIARLNSDEDSFCPVILLADDDGHLIIVSKNGEVFIMLVPTEDMKIKIF